VRHQRWKKYYALGPATATVIYAYRAQSPCAFLNRITFFFLVADWAGTGSLLSPESLKLMEFCLLGALELRGPGESEILSVLSQPKRVALLAYLAVSSPKGFHRRDTIVGLFWPELDQEHARAALRRSLHFLRRFLGEDVILRRGDEELALNWDEVWCDTRAFEEALQEGGEERAVELYRGDLLPGFFLSGCPEFEGWLDEERGRLRESAARAAWAVAHRCLDTGRITKGERMGQQALALVGTDENEVRRFISALAGVGDRAAAIRFYEKFAEGIQNSLDLEPSAETKAVALEIRVGHEVNKAHGTRDSEPVPVTERGSTPAVTAAREAQRPSAVPTSSDAEAEDEQPAKPARSWNRSRGLARRIALVMAFVAMAVVVFAWPRGGPDLPEDVVVVIPFSNETGDAAKDQISKMVAISIAAHLSRAAPVEVVPSGAAMLSWDAALEGRAREPARDPRTAVAAEFGAGTVIWGSIFSQSDSLRFEAEITGAGGVRRDQSVDPVIVHSDSVMNGIETLSERVSTALAFQLDPAWTFAPHFSPPPSLAVYRDFSRAFEAHFRGDLEETRRLVERALRQDSTYLPAKTLLAVTHLNLGNLPEADSLLQETGGFYDRMAPGEQGQWAWARATLDGDREAAYRSPKRRIERFPDPIGTYTVGFEALKMNFPREALAVLSGLDPDTPAMERVAGYWEYLSEALHTLGDHDQELTEAKRGRSRHPDSPRILRAEIRAHAALGNVQGMRDMVRDLVEESILEDARPAQALRVAALELRAHGHDEASRAIGERALTYLRSRPAQVTATRGHRYDLLRVLYLLERWDDAQVITEELALEVPANPNFLGYLGTLSARRGEQAEAVRISQELAGMDRPYLRGSNTRWRACIAALIGEREEAVSLLRQAHEEGMWLSISIHTDMDLEPLRGYPSFEELMRPKG